MLSHLAVLLLALTMLVQPILSWEQPGVILASGQEYPVGHGRDLVVRQGELEIVQHPDGALRNLQVSLVVEAGASPPVTRTVAINQPTTFRGISFHLQSYGPGARLSTPERTYPLAFASDQAQQVLLPQIGVTLRVAYQPEDRNLFVEALDPDGHVLGSGVVAEGTEIRVQGMPLKFTLSPYTVWQVGHDPTFGLAILWSGLMLAGIGLSLWCPHRRLWLRLDSQCLQMVGVGDFAGGFENIASELGRACQAETKDGVEPDAARVADG